MPTYNQGKFIKEAIQSVLNQTFADFELIISDDASEDDTEEIVRHIKDARVKYFRNKNNIGICQNFNRLIKLSKGEYIKFLCADDVLRPNLLERFTEVMDGSSKIGLCFCRNEWIDENGKFIKYYGKYPTNLIIKSKEAFRHFLFEGNGSAPHSAVMVRRNCFSELGNFEVINDKTGWGEDWEMWLRILSKYDLGYITDPLIRIRRHKNTLTHFAYKNNLTIIETYRVLHHIFANPDRYDSLTYKEKRKAFWLCESQIIRRFLNCLKGKDIKQAIASIIVLGKYDSIPLATGVFLYLMFINAIKKVIAPRK